MSARPARHLPRHLRLLREDETPEALAAFKYMEAARRDARRDAAWYQPNPHDWRYIASQPIRPLSARARLELMNLRAKLDAAALAAEAQRASQGAPRAPRSEGEPAP